MRRQAFCQPASTAGRGATADLMARARQMRREPTDAERALWNLVRGSSLGFKFRRQHVIGPFVADFYCHEARLVVEVDGTVHDERVELDEGRDDWMRAHGLRTLRVTNDEALHFPDHVIDAIRNHAQTQRDQARQPSPLHPAAPTDERADGAGAGVERGRG